MQFLEEKYDGATVDRIEVFVPELNSETVQNSPVQSQPEPKQQGYKPNPLQEEIRRVLKEKAGTDKATLVARNGSNYFFRAENGKIVMYTRLHSEIGSQSEDSNISKDKQEEIRSKMKELWQDKAALKQYIENLQKEWNTKLAQRVGETSDTYNEYKVDLSLYTTPEMLNDQNIILAISDLLKGLREDSVSYVGGSWAKAGNIVDEMMRQLLGGRDLEYDGMILIGDTPVLISDVMPQEVFELFIEQAN